MDLLTDHLLTVSSFLLLLLDSYTLISHYPNHCLFSIVLWWVVLYITITYVLYLWERHCKHSNQTNSFNTSRPRQDGRHFADNIFKFISLHANCCILIRILKFWKCFTRNVLIPLQFMCRIHNCFPRESWWRHQMETFSALLAICARNSPVPGELPTQRPLTRSFDVYFYQRPNKRLSKQSGGWWFETLSCPFWRQCNVCLKMRYASEL